MRKLMLVSMIGPVILVANLSVASAETEEPIQRAELGLVGGGPGQSGGIIGYTEPAGVGQPNGIIYHGGPVMINGANVYFIWYGDWSSAIDSAAQDILVDWASNIGGSPYFNINTAYYQASGASVPNLVTYGGSATDFYSRGTSLSDANVRGIVADALARGDLPIDTDGVYFVLTAVDVAETSGFCSRYCGWHTHSNIGGADIKYSFVGNARRCLSGCAAQRTVSPNDNLGGDAMASMMSHELEETATDPDLNAWFDSRGMENADKCQWTFGTTYGLPNGSRANMQLGARDYLIQRNWVNDFGGFCDLSY